MEITNKFLKKMFAIGGIFLYALGFGVTHFNEASKFMRIANQEVMPHDAIEVENDTYVLRWCTLQSDYQTYTFSYMGDDYNVTPVVHYNFYINVQNRNINGEVVYSMYKVSDILDDELLVFMDYDGSDAMYSLWQTDIGDFSYNGSNVNLFDFLLSYNDTDGFIPYGTYKYFGFEFEILFDNQNNGLTCSCVLMARDAYSRNNSWSYYTLREITYDRYFGEDSFDFNNSYDYIYSNVSLATICNLNLDSNTYYNQGIQYVLNNPSLFNLYSYADYLAYGTAKYNEGLEAGNNVLSMSGVINEIFKAPITMFTGIFNSDAFQWRLPTGEILDIGGLMTFLLTIGIALAIVRLIMKVGGK